jgi:predicted HTH transcriptional regulator
MPVIIRKYGRESFTFMPHFIRITIPVKMVNEPQNVHKNVHKNVHIEDLKKRRELIVNLIKADNKISLSALAKEIGVNIKTIQRELADMRHIVQHIGPTRGGHWEFL